MPWIVFRHVMNNVSSDNYIAYGVSMSPGYPKACPHIIANLVVLNQYIGPIVVCRLQIKSSSGPPACKFVSPCNEMIRRLGLYLTRCGIFYGKMIPLDHINGPVVYSASLDKQIRNTKPSDIALRCAIFYCDV